MTFALGNSIVLLTYLFLESGSPFGESFSLPDRYVYSSSYNYSAQASLNGERATFVRIGGIYPIWSKRGYTCRTQASTHTKRADTISDTDSWIIYVKSVFNFGSWSTWILCYTIHSERKLICFQRSDRLRPAVLFGASFVEPFFKIKKSRYPLQYQPFMNYFLIPAKPPERSITQ